MRQIYQLRELSAPGAAIFAAPCIHADPNTINVEGVVVLIYQLPNLNALINCGMWANDRKLPVIFDLDQTLIDSKDITSAGGAMQKMNDRVQEINRQLKDQKINSTKKEYLRQELFELNGNPKAPPGDARLGKITRLIRLEPTPQNKETKNQPGRVICTTTDLEYEALHWVAWRHKHRKTGKMLYFRPDLREFLINIQK